MKTGNTWTVPAPMWPNGTPQWSPVMKTGNTIPIPDELAAAAEPQWSPVMKTGNTSIAKDVETKE